MKKIEAIIKPFKLDEVKDALNDIGVTAPSPAQAMERLLTVKSKVSIRVFIIVNLLSNIKWHPCQFHRF
jgi:hypothetical protein